MIKILVYPYDGNPYQGLLYNTMQSDGHKIKISYDYCFPVVGSLPLLVTAAVRRIFGYRIIHIHWPAFRVGVNLPFSKRISYALFIFTIWWVKFLRYKLVWTVHNVTPHESHTSNDSEAAKYLAQKADHKIVHSAFTIQQMKRLGLNTENFSIIPHGNYQTIYKSDATRQASRRNLGIHKNELMILFFGKIRPYKGLEYLLDVFENSNFKNVKLVIAGECRDKVLRARIKQLESRLNISFVGNHIPEDDVPTYFRAADVACLPFRKITTSGSALLALSFGVPVIAPKMGALIDLPTSVGYLYNQHEKDALLKSLKLAIGNQAELKKAGDNALKYAKALSWNSIAERTYGMYEEILSEK